MRPLRYLRGRWKRIAILFAILVVVANVLAARHARAFLVYDRSAQTVPQPERLTRWQKLGMLVNGVSVPRPENRFTPEQIDLPYSTHRLATDDTWLEAWHVPAAEPRGIVLMFPGYAGAKDTLLPEAAWFHAAKFDIIMVDFRGAGGSSGSDNTLGIREGEDVVAAVQFARDRWPSQRVVLFGRSMGAAAVLRALARHDVKADAIILECPFDRMLNTVRNRFRAMGVPSFPGAEMLVFWGGHRLGFDGFSHNPEEYADSIRTPVLILSGARDERATPEQVRSVDDRLGGPKHLVFFPDAGHEALLPRDPPLWSREVGAFLRSLK